MLQGRLVRLRPMEERDIDAYLGWINESQLARLIVGSPVPISSTHMVRELENSSGFHGQNLFFAIEPLFAEGLVGFCFLKNLHPLHRFVELEQFFIGEKRFRQNGYGRDAMEVLLHYGFTELNLNRLWVVIYAYNQEAIQFYRKCGFLKEGLLRQIQFTRGEYQDGVIMAILKKNWTRKIH